MVCSSLLALGLAAQNTVFKADETTALSSVKQAMGGTRWDQIRTLHTEGKVELGELQGDYDAWLDLRRMFSYVELRFSHPVLGDLRFANGWNGSLGWSADQTGDVCVNSSESGKHDAAANAYLEAFGYLLKSASPVSVTVNRDASLRGQHFHILLVTPPAGSPFELWTDSSTGRLARIVPLKGVDRDWISYGDFRLSDGLLMPFRLEEHDADSGKLSAIRTIRSIEIDRDPPEHRFDPPPGVLSGLDFPPRRDSVSLQFSYENGHIYLPVSINGRRFEKFVFDTGGENTVDVAVARSMGLKIVRAGAAYGGAGKSVENGLTKVERLEIGGLHLENQPINAIPLADVGLANGGVVGYELAKRSVVTIEYGLHRITFTKPESFRPPAGATRLPLHFGGRTSVLVEASVEGESGEFELDTGSPGSLLLYRRFAEQSGLLQKYTSATRKSVRGVGGKSGAIFFSPAGFVISNLTPANPVAGILLSKTGVGAQEGVAGSIGNAILRQYKVTLDYGNAALYLESDPSYRDDGDWTLFPQRQDQKKRGELGDLGLSGLRRRSGGPIEITSLAAGGAASRAGVKRGDWILAVDGAPVGDIPREALFGKLFPPPGTVVRLTIRHDAVTREFRLTTQ